MVHQSPSLCAGLYLVPRQQNQRCKGGRDQGEEIAVERKHKNQSDVAVFDQNQAQKRPIACFRLILKVEAMAENCLI